MSIYRLYFGRNIPNSKQEVSDLEITNFLQSQDLFEYLTYYNAFGIRKNELEKTIVVEIISDDYNKIQTLAKLYKDNYHQESVLIIETQDKNTLV